MHIITTARAQIAGRLFPPGTVLDLPEAEAMPAIEAGTAEPWMDPAAAALPGELGVSTVDGGTGTPPAPETVPGGTGTPPAPETVPGGTGGQDSLAGV
jgi:hypothetical protein